MITVQRAIEELAKFPRQALLKVSSDALWISRELRDASDDLDLLGRIDCPPWMAAPKKTQPGQFKGWDDATAEPAAVQLCRFLQTHPEAALDIAMKALEGLYIDQADGMTMLTGDNAYPRGSGSDFVEDIGQALETAGMMPLIDRLQAEQEKREEES